MTDREFDPVDILLVEDNPGDVKLTQEAFKEGGIANTFHVVTDGVEALDFLFQREEYADAPRPDFVLLDLNLPRKSGDEVLEELRADPDCKDLPVIILTGSSAQEDVVRSYELAANAYLTKPVDPGEFIETILATERYWLSVVRLPTDTDLG
ncbi:regulator of RpoS [Halalkalicoccus paucihalophilus]|uniref:Regulator of RpoS n=1 Tax=Halalkalicoccus paucihalophilus TaxID=1008153 RepID=A0A151AI87_9EURY|nr:response regulator [Halalkalicoccus paucihalophilus]KYH27379.1 regulator of RpoS [Halalkalicoccus paucihalophilus]